MCATHQEADRNDFPAFARPPVRFSSPFEVVDMDKHAVIRRVVDHLTAELNLYLKAARIAHAEATHEQSKAENKYDTRGLEASYLARGQSQQARELENAIGQFAALVVRPHVPGTPLGLGDLVELTTGRETDLYLLGPGAGGTEVVHGGREVTVITPQSPLGSQLFERRTDGLEIRLGGSSRPSRVSAVW